MDLKAYWNNRYKNGLTSGYGSYGDALIQKLGWLVGLDVKSVSEIGCGDFNFGKHLMAHYPQATYTGNDISEYIVNKNKLLYPQYTFLLDQDVPDADLLLCIDVLYHNFSDEEYNKLLDRLDKYTKYLAVTAYERDEEYTGSHVRIRNFDYKRYGEPIIHKICEENGSLYFYLWKR